VREGERAVRVRSVTRLIATTAPELKLHPGGDRNPAVATVGNSRTRAARAGTLRLAVLQHFATCRNI